LNYNLETIVNPNKDAGKKKNSKRKGKGLKDGQLMKKNKTE
jgi:hypothetical protein